jgi:hypothetical protein
MSENPGATRTDQRGDRSNRRRANRGQSGQAIEAPCLADQLGAHIRQYGRSNLAPLTAHMCRYGRLVALMWLGDPWTLVALSRCVNPRQ